MKIDEAILDIGLQTNTKGSRIYAALQGVLDAGVNVPHSDKILPSKERLNGSHIAAWADKGKFTKYGIDAKTIANHFEEIKKIIMESKGEKK
jgi:large subunit ribosomal protein L18